MEKRSDNIKVSAPSKSTLGNSGTGEIRLRKTRPTGRKFWIFSVMGVLLAAALAATVHFFLIVETVSVEGNLYYNSEDVIARSGIEIGKNMYAFSIKGAEDNIINKLGGISDVKISRRLPNEIVITVKEHVPSMYITIGDVHYILSADMLVLKSTDVLSPEDGENLVKVKISAVKGCIAGEKLSTADADTAYLVEDLYAALCKYDFISDTREIDFRDKFNISFKYGEDYTVKLGNALNIPEKLDMARKIMDKADVKNGTVDVSDDSVSKGIHTPNR